jgi:hypothetical protein
MDAINIDLERRVEQMSLEQREHLKALIYELVRCYEKDGKHCAVIICGTTDEGIDNFLTMNCTNMEAGNLMLAANDFIGYLNAKDAPPKEKFN